jgi:hypothetical protein
MYGKGRGGLLALFFLPGFAEIRLLSLSPHLGFLCIRRHLNPSSRYSARALHGSLAAPDATIVHVQGE